MKIWIHKEELRIIGQTRPPVIDEQDISDVTHFTARTQKPTEKLEQYIEFEDAA